MQPQLIKVNQPVIGIEYKIISHSDVSSHSTDQCIANVIAGKHVGASNQTMEEKVLQNTRDESFQSGYIEGKKAGTLEMNQQFEDMSEEFKAMVSAFRNEYDRALECIETPLVQLSIRIAEKILGIELTKKEKMSEYLSSKVKEILKDIKNQSNITIHVNPIGMKWVNDKNIIADLNIPVSSDINFIEDDRLQPGECIVETSEFIVDNTFQYQLEILQQQMLEE